MKPFFFSSQFANKFKMFLFINVTLELTKMIKVITFTWANEDWMWKMSAPVSCESPLFVFSLRGPLNGAALEHFTGPDVDLGEHDRAYWLLVFEVRLISI